MEPEDAALPFAGACSSSNKEQGSDRLLEAARSWGRVAFGFFAGRAIAAGRLPGVGGTLVFVKLVPQGPHADVQDLRRLCAIVPAAFKGNQNVPLLQFGQSRQLLDSDRGGGLGRGCRGRLRRDGRRTRHAGQTQVSGFDQRRVGSQDDGPFDHVLQLPDVARPVVAKENPPALIRKVLGGATMLARSPNQEVVGQEQNVVPPLAQGRDVNGHNVESKEEVFAEFLSLDALLEAAVGGGNDAHVHLDGTAAPDPFELAFLEHPQQLGLGGGGNLAALIEQGGGAVCGV